MDNQQTSAPEATANPITLQSIIECKVGTTTAMGKILSGSSTNEQLIRMDNFQTICIKNFAVLKKKLEQEVRSDSNIKLSIALDNTQNRINLEHKMIKFLIKSDTPEAGIKGEEILGYVFAAKMIAPKENQSWMEYRQSLENEKTAPSKGSPDFVGWGLLIIMLLIVGRALLKKQETKKTTEL